MGGGGGVEGGYWGSFGVFEDCFLGVAIFLGQFGTPINQLPLTKNKLIIPLILIINIILIILIPINLR